MFHKNGVSIFVLCRKTKQASMKIRDVFDGAVIRIFKIFKRFSAAGLRRAF
jgi:hypothetical protein